MNDLGIQLKVKDERGRKRKLKIGWIAGLLEFYLGVLEMEALNRVNVATRLAQPAHWRRIMKYEVDLSQIVSR